LKNLRIATRESPLALWQAEFVRDQLQNLYPGLAVELLRLKTQGDKILDKPLSEVGGKGLFLKELEQQLLDRTADIAVHSMKDVTIDLPPGLKLAVIMERADARDVLIANHYSTLAELPAGSRIGTSSLRRQSQLRARRPDLMVQNLRGNVGTRLRKLDEQDYDGIILAAAGIARLLLEHRIREYLSADVMLPAVGQGAIGIETRSDDPEILQILRPLNNNEAEIQITAERAFSRRLYGGCQLPIAAYAEVTGNELFLRGLVGRVDGSEIITGAIRGQLSEAEDTGLRLADELLSKGGDRILRELIDVR
jgi:hydroxymethylbilane synthase